MRHFRLCLLLGAGLLTAIPVAAQGQADPSLTSALGIGSRIRLVSTSVQAPMKGVVVGLDEENLTFAQEVGPPLRIPLPAVTKLDVSRGHKRHWLVGLGAGVAAGVLIGLAMPVDSDNCGPEDSNFCSRGEAMLGGTLLFGPVGLLVGGLVKTEQWTPVTLGPKPNLSSAGRPGGFQVAVRLRF